MLPLLPSPQLKESFLKCFVFNNILVNKTTFIGILISHFRDFYVVIFRNNWLNLSINIILRHEISLTNILGKEFLDFFRLRSRFRFLDIFIRWLAFSCIFWIIFYPVPLLIKLIIVINNVISSDVLLFLLSWFINWGLAWWWCIVWFSYSFLVRNNLTIRSKIILVL